MNQKILSIDDESFVVYGTLLKQSRSKMSAFLKTNSRIVGEGSFPGLLYDLGDYPGAIFIPECQSKVYGTIHYLSNPANTLRLLDKYEETGPEFQQPNEYIREIIQ